MSSLREAAKGVVTTGGGVYNIGSTTETKLSLTHTILKSWKNCGRISAKRMASRRIASIMWREHKWNY